MTKDVKAYSPIRNLFCYKRQNAIVLKDQIKQLSATSQ